MISDKMYLEAEANGIIIDCTPLMKGGVHYE